MTLVKAEFLKLRTTSVWWIFGIILIPLWAAAILINWVTTHALAGEVGTEGLTAQQAEQVRASGEAVNVAANLYTSGQYIGLLITLLLGAIIVTNEFFHQTATTTFLISPVRERVVLAKLAVSVAVGLIIWFVTSVLNLIFAPIVLNAEHVPVQLGSGAIWRAILLNGLAFALWAVLGVGAGVLIRNQLAATIVLSAVYVIGTSTISAILALLGQYVWEFFEKLTVLVPTAASQLLISGDALPGNPPRWVGALVLVGYAAIMGFIGTTIMKRRDIS